MQTPVVSAIEEAETTRRGKLVATPSVTHMIFMLRLCDQFGFDGDDTPAGKERGQQLLDDAFRYASDSSMQMSARMEDADFEHPTKFAEYHMGTVEDGGSLSMAVYPFVVSNTPVYAPPPEVF